MSYQFTPDYIPVPVKLSSLCLTAPQDPGTDTPIYFLSQEDKVFTLSLLHTSLGYLEAHECSPGLVGETSLHKTLS